MVRQKINFDIESWPRPVLFIFLAFNICFWFSVPGYLHKFLFREFSLNFPIFYAFIQSFFVALFAAPSTRQVISSKKNLSANLYFYIFTSIAFLFSFILDNYSVTRLSYPTEVLFKSTKIFPVMVGNIVFLKKSFNPTEILTFSILVSGFVGIALSDFTGNNVFDIHGLVSVILSLTFEAITANMEEYILVFCGATRKEAISILFSFSSFFALILSIVTGEMKRVIIEISEQPEISIYLLFYSIFGAVGLQFVFLTIKTFGSLQAVIFTSTRKAGASLFAFLACGYSPLSLWQIISSLLTATGLAMNFFTRTKSNNAEKLAHSEYRLLHAETTTDPLLENEI
ncbi:Slc35b3 protein [Tritrichomonas foetus]|uniref:Slc35b3 protein n=1 Tax=Tritrichomonas foetus TaxID=1144522 RepID=A0A1J4KC66_9EUKA|nr:Slc35b3 protein [Tritrichomonas foetus]|eukprot:OHT07053.1 Slc35b3 protein [Tritrichomonas foetus]